MTRVTTLILFALVLALGAAIWLQTEREDPEAGVVRFPLFEDLDTRRLVRARWDNIERSIHITMEREEGGRWFMIDPIAYPARPEFMVQLMEALSNVAWRVPEGDGGADLGLDPPRAVLEVTESISLALGIGYRFAFDVDEINVLVIRGEDEVNLVDGWNFDLGARFTF